ncbi:MAG: YCF48-related protein [Ignavibacteriaceae bacterium]
MRRSIELILKHGIKLSIIFSLTIAAQDWQLQNSNTTNQLKGIHMISQTTGWACGDAGTLLYTDNAGQSWNNVIITGADLHQLVFKNELTGVVVGDNGSVFVTTNGGLNWNARSSNTSAQLRSVDYAGGSVFYAAGRDGAVIKSNDDGNTWTPLASGTTERLLCISAIGDFVWIGGRNGVLIYSVNGGSTFSPMANPATDDINDIQFVNTSTGFAAGSNSFFMYTSDGGVNWTSRSSGILAGLNGLHFMGEQKGWTVGGNGTIYSTTNAGITWTLLQSGTNEDLNSIHSFDSENFWAVGNSGIITTNYTPATSVERIKTSSPNSFIIEQNYPNPFNPSTKIRFGISDESNILLEVYNITGQKIAELVNQRLSPGFYNVNFDASGLSSGIYIYSIKGSDFSVTRKMTLLR